MKKKKRIVLIGINFYPEDTAIGYYSSDMVNYLAKSNFDIQVITGFPYYPQWKIQQDYQNKSIFTKEVIDNNIKVFRYKQYVPSQPTFFKRILHIIDFTFGSLINLFRINKPDIIIAISPFTSSIFLGWLLKLRWKKSNFWVHIQDFEFDAALQSGMLKENNNILLKSIFKILHSCEKYLYSKANTLSTISKTMLEKLNSFDTNNQTYLLPNWIDENLINPKSIEDNDQQKHPYINSSKFNILYSGNIGNKQDWSFFEEFIKKLNSEKIQVIVVGDGAMKEEVEKKSANSNIVQFHQPVPLEELSLLLCSADLHILFQKDQVIDTVMPSKLLGMMASSKPSLIVGNKESEVKKIIEISESGLFLENSESTIDQSLSFINKLINDESYSKRIGKNARDYVLKKYTKENILSDFIKQLLS